MNRRRAARLGAIQALYQLELTGAPTEQVVEEFERHRLADLLEPLELAERPLAVDRAWFATVTRGTWRRASELDPLLAAMLSPGWTLDRLGYLLRACLRAGAFEIADRPEVPAEVAIQEYVALAHEFLTAEESGFVNAILDRLARRLRPGYPARTRPPPSAGG